jgi:integrase
MELTAKTVAALVLPEGKTDHIIWDDKLPGFGLRLRAGADDKTLSSFIAQYRFAGRTRRLLLGNAAVMTVADARDAARKALGKVANGEDPAAKRDDRRAKDAVAFTATVQEYLVIKRGEVRPKTFEEIERYLTDRRYFGPLHSLALDAVARKDVAARLLVITRECGPTTAARARTNLSGFFAWAMANGLVDANPVVGTAAIKEPPSRERVLSDDELAAIWRTAVAADNTFGRIIQLLILTGGQRRGEVGGMRDSELDEAAGTWTLPPERTKNGRKHVLPLPPAAWAIIGSAPRMAGSEHVFSARSPRGFTDFGGAKAAFDVKLGDAVKPWRLHDIRRTVATGMANIGVQPHIIEAALNHQSGHKAGVAGIYNRSPYEREIRAALARWADHVLALVEGRARKVVVFPVQSA